MNVQVRVLALAGIAQSSMAAESGSPEMAPEIDLTSAVLQVVVGLGLVILLILALAWVLKRVTRLHNTHQQMKVVSSLALGTRERAVLIEVGGRQLLLGVSPGRVSLLESFPDPVITSSANVDFASQLKASISSQRKKARPDTPLAESGTTSQDPAPSLKVDR